MMLQQNWALIESDQSGGVRVYFISDTSGVFDEMAFQSSQSAAQALRRNDFRRYAGAADLQSFLRPPRAPYHRSQHPNGPIYSSGRYWKS
jgi:hypothetical protein